MRLGDARTRLTLVPWSVCPLRWLVAYNGPPDVALMMPFYENCCVSTESDWFWFCVSIESVSHQNKLIALNVNVFTGKIRSLLMSHVWEDEMEGVDLPTICSYPTMESVRGGTQHTPYQVCFEVIWIMFLPVWLPVRREQLFCMSLEPPNLLLSFRLTYTTLLLAFLSSILFPSTSASVIIISFIKYSWYEFWSGETQGPMLWLICEEEHPPYSKSSEGPIDAPLPGRLTHSASLPLPAKPGVVSSEGFIPHSGFRVRSRKCHLISGPCHWFGDFSGLSLAQPC